MSCCGQKRLQWQKNKSNTEPAPIAQEIKLENPVSLRYHGRFSRMAKGAITGYLYLFSAQEPELLVDNRDVPMLLEGSPELSRS
jgi:hypothetical protein